MTSAVICAADPARNLETQEERVDRLGVQDKMKQKVKREIAEQELYG